MVLSLPIDTFRGCSDERPKSTLARAFGSSRHFHHRDALDEQFCTLRPDHIGDVDRSLKLLRSNRLPLKFENRSRSRRPRSSRSSATPLIVRFTRHDSHNFRAGYPEGNFGGNQLSEGSIGLSPLRAGRAIDLHVRTASALHRSFDRLQPAQA